MTEQIRDMSSSELALFGSIVARLQQRNMELEERQGIITDVASLLRAEASVSFMWDDRAARFKDAKFVNVNPDNIKRFQDHFQFNDPWADKMRSLRKPVPMEWIVPAEEFERSQVFNEILAPDNLYRILGLYISHQDKQLGRLTVLRGRQSPAFEERDVALLSVLSTFIAPAFRPQAADVPNFTRREREVVQLVAKGCSDRDIARILEIAFYTVRTHISNALEKAGCANRTELAGFIAARMPVS